MLRKIEEGEEEGEKERERERERESKRGMRERKRGGRGNVSGCDYDFSW